MNNKQIICAIDSSSLDYSYNLVSLLKGKVAAIKLGLEFFISYGINGVKKISELKVPIFLDLKLHDIPNTISKTAVALKCLDIFMLTVHISGGRNMLQAIVEEFFGTDVKVIGVSVLTSLSDQDMKELNITVGAEQQAIDLAKIAKDCGLNGMVCSGYEIPKIRKEIAGNFMLVTPGIRPNFSHVNDHKRSMSPFRALKLGADYLVIGRPITNSLNPIEALEKILTEINS